MTNSSNPAARRKLDFEQILCTAIGKRLQVALMYDRDVAERTFDPYAVYESTTGKICVSGNQVHNPAKPQEKDQPHTLEIGKISLLRVTDLRFQVDSRFNIRDPKYSRVYCSV